MAEENKDQQGAGNKVRKKYKSDLENLTRVLGGDFLFTPTKLVSNEIMEAVKELAKTEKEKLVKSFQERAIAAIQKQREHLRNVAKLKKEFETKEEESMKEFSSTVEGLFKDLEDIKNIEENYFNILMGKTVTEDPEEKEKGKEDEGKTE